MLQDQPGPGADGKSIDRLVPRLAGLRDALRWMPPDVIARRSRAVLKGKTLELDMLFEPYTIDTDSFVVGPPDGPEASSFTQALILTYLHTADGTPDAGRWIGFRELPDGAFYHQAFQGYAADRLARQWGLEPAGFAEACQALGGYSVDLGDVGYRLRVLPRVDLAVVYWLGDDNLPSRASILFDANAPHYMVTDGLAILGSRLVDKLLR